MPVLTTWTKDDETPTGDYGERNAYSFKIDTEGNELAVLEGARRAIGWPLPTVALLALVYGIYGQYLPGEFGHSGMPLKNFLGTLTIAEGGIWGGLTGISVNIVAVFVIFGAVLNAGEAGQQPGPAANQGSQ